MRTNGLLTICLSLLPGGAGIPKEIKSKIKDKNQKQNQKQKSKTKNTKKSVYFANTRSFHDYDREFNLIRFLKTEQLDPASQPVK